MPRVYVDFYFLKTNELFSSFRNSNMKILSEDFKIGKLKFSFAAFVWFLLAILGALLKIRLGHASIQNFLIFRNAFWHAINQTSLYYLYPSEHLDSYLYGPVFSIIISPFALLPIDTGAFLWVIANAAILFFAIRKLPVSYKNQNIILLISAIEMMTCLQNMQSNCLLAALIILAFAFVKNGKDFWATLFVAVGFLVKLYGVVGIVFFLFSNNKKKFLGSFIFWIIILFCLPMLISSPSFIVHSYGDWYHTLIKKDNTNASSLMQNISVMGMLRNLIQSQYLDLVVIFIAAWFYLIPLFRLQQLKNKNFQLTYLCFALIGVVIFSSSAESPTYIIAMTGVAIWFVIQNPKSPLAIFLLVFALCFTSLSATDFFPRYIKLAIIRPYSLKALPCFMVWLVIAVQLLFRNFNSLKAADKLKSSGPILLTE